MSRLLAVGLSAFCLALPAGAEEKASPVVAADLVLLNGKIWTVNRAQAEVEAMAIVRDRIAEVGATAKLRRLIGPKTRVLDVKGRRVVPGFYDSHVHLLGSGLRLAEVGAQGRHRRGGVRQAAPRLRSQAAARSLAAGRRVGPRSHLRRPPAHCRVDRQVRPRSASFPASLRWPHGRGQ